MGRGEAGAVEAEGVAEAVHVDGARDASGEQIGPFQAALFEVAQLSADAELDAAALFAPCSDQRGQTGDVAHRHTAAVVALQAVVDADGRGSGRGIVARQFADPVGRDAGDPGRALGRPFLQAFGQLLEADRVGSHIVLVVEVGVDDLVHHAQREGAVGPGADGQPLVGGPGGAGAGRVDDDDACALFARVLDEGPEVQVAGEGVAAPDQDQAGVGVILRLDPDG